MNRRPFSLLLISVFFVLLLDACATNSAILPAKDSRIINAGSSFGQTFTAQNTGLSGISVLFAPSGSPSSGNLLYHLRASPKSNDDLTSGHLPLSEITTKKYYTFSFPLQNDSQQKDYYLQVEVEGEGNVQIYSAAADSYLDGALYENLIPQEAQLGFRLEYDRYAYLLGLGKSAIKWIGILVVGVFAFILPGWALFSLFWRDWDELNWISKLGLSGGLSLAIYPLLLLWTELFGLHLGAIYAWLPPLASLLVLGWKNRKSFFMVRPFLHQNIKLWGKHKLPPVEILLADISFFVILGFVVITRMWVTRSIDVPLFGDSYQHTMLTQLIIDNGGLFNSWKPYADLITLTYHFGFHSAAAVFQWITGIATPRAVLWTGQLINILAILGLYPLAYKISKNQWAGVVAMLIGGLLSSMPMSYINWGRYTQLAGQAILPATIWTIWSLLERPVPALQNISWVQKLVNFRNLSYDFGSLAITWITLGGLALTHYRILIWIILFFPAYMIISFQRKHFISLTSRIFWIGIGGAILFIPWFFRVFWGKIMNIVAIQITTLPSAITSFTKQYNDIGGLQNYLPILIWILLGFSLSWCIWKQKKELIIFAFWWFLIILAANPLWIGLPGTGVITNFAVVIAFYIPAGVVVGSTMEWILHNPQQKETPDLSNNNWKSSSLVLSSIAVVILCGLGIWGIPQRIKDLKIPTYALVTRPDLRAMEWIRANTPMDARFLINSFSAYGDTSIVGSDAGWWIPLLALRQSTVPPLTYSAEQGITPDYGQKVKAFYDVIKENGIVSPVSLEFLKEQGVNYVYIGQRQGRVNYSGPQILDPQVLINDQHFRLVYHEDRVWLFSIQYW